jgi:hypothetical protein
LWPRIGELLAPLGELAIHQLPRDFVSNLARQLLQFDKRASGPQTLLLLPGKLPDDPRNPAF